MRKATKKASVAIPAPKNWATIMSRIKPKIRERRVAPPTIPAALAIVFCSSMAVRYSGKGREEHSARSGRGLIALSREGCFEKHLDIR